MRSTVLILSLALLGACAAEAPPATASKTQPAVAAASAASAPVVVAKQECHRETRVGTNLPQTVCGPAATDADHMDSRDQAKALAGSPAAVNLYGSGGR